MGLGGYLTWTAVIHEIHKATGRRCVPGERWSTGFFPKIEQIFLNNPAVAADVDLNDPDKFIRVAMNNPATNYCKQDTPERAIHRYDKHIILQILEHYGFPQITLDEVRCRLYLNDDETSRVEQLIEVHGLTDKPFVTIEPYSNTEYTVNRAYPHEKWQHVVDELKDHITVVQLGVSLVPKLNYVVDMRGDTTFRTAAGIVGRSKTLLSTEGGLVHAATAFDVPSVVVITGYQHPDMVAYPRNTNLWIHGDHGPCGLKRRCDECWKHVLAHDPDEIVADVKRRLEL
jgi:ADP-heptose:LPS heptosyltransferase